MFGLKDEMIEEIRKVLKKHQEVRSAKIFGSRARGDYKYNSDIDIAIYSSGELSGGIWTELDEAAGIYKIDIVDMDSSLDEKFRQKIEEQGIEVYLKK